jgi:hypothetical protein
LSPKALRLSRRVSIQGLFISIPAFPLTYHAQKLNMATHSQPYFRFMDLPVELCLIVYEFLPRTIKHTRIVPPATPGNPKLQVKLILVTKHVPTAILATCREVYTEANAIVQKIVKRFILDSPPKIIHAFASDDELEKIFLAVSIELIDVRVS